MLNDLIIYTPMFTTLYWAIALLLSYRQKNRAKSFLGIFMGVAFLLYLSHAVYFKSYQELYLYFDPIYTFASLSVFPLYYLYIKLLTIELALDYKSWLVLIPAILLSFLTALVYIVMSPEERHYYQSEFLFHHSVQADSSNLIKLQKAVYYISRFVFSIQVIYFLFRGSRLVVRYNKSVANFYSNLENRTINWVKFLLYSFVITSAMSIVFNVLGKTIFIETPVLLIIPSIIFTVLLFAIGFQGNMQNYTVVDFVEDNEHDFKADIKKINHDKLKQQVIELFEKDKIYKQVDLKMSDLSGMLLTNRTYISSLINQDFSCSFNDFVNRYRIKEAKELLQDQSTQIYTIDYIAETVGFGSLHTFIRVFKSIEKITPGRYRDKIEVDNEFTGTTS